MISMLFSQIMQSLWFYFIFSIFSVVGIYFTYKLFPHNFSLAYFSAKVLGLSIFGIFIWLLASLKILNYQNNILIVLLFIMAICSGVVWLFKTLKQQHGREEKFKILKNILTLEVISLVLYVGYLVIRSYNPAAYGTERFMDMALLNSSLKTETFPFIDPWYAGKFVNYYYFGHYLSSIITKLSGLSSFFAYNFAIGILYTSSFMLSGLLVYEIIKSKIFAGLAGFFVTTAGSIFYSGCVINTWLKDLPICSYASSTRLYTPSYIINEIPSYSFTVGDLHAHFLALPFFILNLILIYSLVKSEKPRVLHMLSLLFSLTASALINPSDATTLALILTIFWIYRVYQLFKNRSSALKFIKSEQFRPWLSIALFLMFGVVILTLPFLFSFTSPVLGFGFAPLYAKANYLVSHTYQFPTPFLAILGMWGVFLGGVSLTFYTIKNSWKEQEFLTLLFIASIFLIIFVELFFVKDIYHIANPPYFRANTVFKYGYHTWTMLSLSFVCCMALIYQKLKIRKKQTVIVLPLSVIIFLSLFYPYQAIKQFYPKPTFGLTLDAADFFNRDNKDDLDTINWINKNIKDRSVILEAVGDSYTYFGRMSVFTGQITPMGWKSHEWTWRFQGSEASKAKAIDPKANVETGYGAVSIVADDVSRIYQGKDLTQVKKLVDKYGIQYIYVGNLEKMTYQNLNTEKLLQLGKVVYSSQNSKLIKVR